jgi:PBSX family phage terminase large subunit
MKLNYGPRLERWALRPPELDKKISLLVGSVRSGKTWALHAKILYLCKYPVGGRLLLTGVSKASIKTNVLTDLFDLVGNSQYHYNSQSGELRLCGANWLVYGASDEGSEKYLRGATVGAVVCDETVLMPLSYWQMLLTRLSPPGARLYASTNTASPMHWLKKDYIDNDKLRGILSVLNVTMRDNPNLDPSYIADQEKQFTGVFYRRMILGEWAMGSGQVYAGAWNDNTLYDDKSRLINLYTQGGCAGHIIAIDYGTTNPLVMLDFIDGADGVVYCDREYYWDSKKENRQKTDAEYVVDLEKFIAESNCRTAPKIIIDPSAASFKVECQRRGMWVVDADNDVVSYGLQRTASALAQHKLKFHRDHTSHCQAEMQNYAWDTKKAEGGVEQPIKRDDHTCDAVRYMVNDVFKYAWRLTNQG